MEKRYETRSGDLFVAVMQDDPQFSRVSWNPGKLRVILHNSNKKRTLNFVVF